MVEGNSDEADQWYATLDTSGHSIQTLHPNNIIVSNKLLGLLGLGLG